MDLKEIGVNKRNWVDSDQNMDYWRILVNTTSTHRISSYPNSSRCQVGIYPINWQKIIPFSIINIHTNVLLVLVNIFNTMIG